MEFQNLKQGDLSVHRYWEKFTRLLKYVPPYQQDTNLKVRNFIMGLNNRIGGAVDVLAPRTMEEALEKVVRQEHKVKKDDSIRDNKRKTIWNSESVESGPPRKQFRDFKNNKPEKKSIGTRDIQENFHVSKSDRNNERRGPPGGCYICTTITDSALTSINHNAHLCHNNSRFFNKEFTQPWITDKRSSK
jgi:hypothetical protein